MNCNKPLITIITACLNSEKNIRTTIESVLGQTYETYEYIIKDGGSSDKTVSIAEEYREKFGGRLRIITEKDRSMYEAMNQGIQHAQGDIIGIINSDDYYSCDTLEKVARMYSCSNNPFYIVIGDMERVSESGELIYRYHFTQSMVDKKSCFGHPSMFVAKAVYEKIGLYDTSYRLASDGEWQFRAMEDENILVELCPDVFNHMREGGASDLRRYRWKWFKERSRIQLEHGRGSRLKIYSSEFKKVLVCDVKATIPNKFKGKFYAMKYQKGKKQNYV